MHVWKFILPYIVLWNNSYDILRHGKYLTQLIQDGHRNALRHLLAEVKIYYLCA